MGKQSLFPRCLSHNFTVLPHCSFSESQLPLKGKSLILISQLKCMFIHLLTRLYLIPLGKISRAKGNNRTDRHLLDRSSRLLLTSVQLYLISGYSFLKRQRRTKNHVKRLRWSFFGENKGWFYSKLYPPCRKTSRPKDSNAMFLLDSFSRVLLTLV